MWIRGSETDSYMKTHVAQLLTLLASRDVATPWADMYAVVRPVMHTRSLHIRHNTKRTDKRTDDQDA